VNAYHARARFPEGCYTKRFGEQGFQRGIHMSFVTTQPEALAAAASSLQSIGSSLSAQNAAAAAPTTGMVPAAADEVLALTAPQFAAQSRMAQAVSAQATAIQELFVNTLGISSGSDAATEAANAAAAG
jgi:predicted DNA-binding transcriptional regulator YafY